MKKNNSHLIPAGYKQLKKGQLILLSDLSANIDNLNDISTYKKVKRQDYRLTPYNGERYQKNIAFVIRKK